MIRYLLIIAIGLTAGSCKTTTRHNNAAGWSIHVLPSSIRLDPVSNEIIEHRFKGVETSLSAKKNLLKKNWVYDGKQVTLHGARGEYISFQLVITNHTDSTLKGINVEMTPFKGFGIHPELFLEWAVEVKTPSTGYPKASLGKGWYPDALIPFKYIQADSSGVEGRWTYPLWLPDFNNRITGQRSQIIWIDQYIPFEYESAKPGSYSSTVSVTIGAETKTIPVNLNVWNFAIPNENKFKIGRAHV